MNATLVVVADNSTKRKVALKLPCVLGRSREADTTVPHPLISRRHCELSEADGLLMLRDLVSLNGTMIGGRRIISAPLLPEAEFTIGPLTFRVMYDYEGDLEALPPINYVDEAADADEVEFADVEDNKAGAPMALIGQPMAELGEPPTEFLPETPHEPRIDEVSIQPSAASHESPWAAEACEVESAKQPTTTQKTLTDRTPTSQTPPLLRKQPNYGDESDPELGSFLEDLR